ncbi:MAG: hypothetical protein ACKV2O_22325 [Acidimicrobiales bacterium]
MALALNLRRLTVDDPVMAFTRSSPRHAATLAGAAAAIAVLMFTASCRTLEAPGTDAAGTAADANGVTSPATTRRAPLYGGTSVVTTSTTAPGAQVPTGTVKIETPATNPPPMQPRTVVPPAETTTTVPPTTTTAVGTVLLKVRDSQFGLIVVDGVNHTLYASAADPSGVGLCSGACTEQWVPIPGYLVITDGAVNPALVGRVARADGLVQLTYAGLPLYRLNNEPLGVTMGQGDAAQWFVVSIEGSLLAG